MKTLSSDSLNLSPQQIHSLQAAINFLTNHPPNIQTNVSSFISEHSITQIPLQNAIICVIKYILEDRLDFFSSDFQQRALALSGGLFESCEPQTMLLVEIYILPIVTEYCCLVGGRERKKGQVNSKEKNQQQFKKQQLCTKAIESLITWAQVKPKRLYQCSQMNENSIFTLCLHKIRQFHSSKTEQMITEKDLCSMFQLSFRRIKQKAKKLRTHYLSKLIIIQEEDTHVLKQFSVFYMHKFLDEMKAKKHFQGQNQNRKPLHQVISELKHFKFYSIPQIQYKQLYKTLDVYLTSPLLKFVLNSLESADNFQNKKTYVHILSQLIRWGDIQAYLSVTYSEIIEEIAGRISLVQGEKSLEEGRNIYPQVDDMEKGKFYVQFLRFFDIFGHCVIEEDLQNSMQVSKVRLYYDELKKHRRFVFPQNLMMKKIQEEFLQNMRANLERNSLILNTIKLSSASSVNYQLSSFSTTPLQERLNFVKRVEEMEKVREMLLSLEDEEKLSELMDQLDKFEEEYENQLQKIEHEEQIANKIFYESLLKAEFFVEAHYKIKDHFNQFQWNKITFEQFKLKVKNVYQNIREYNSQNISHKSFSKSSIEDRANFQESSVGSFHNFFSHNYYTISPKYNDIDHSSSYSREKNKSYFQFHKQKNMSDRIDSVIKKMKKFCQKKMSIEGDELHEPSQSPSLNSFCEEIENIGDFRNCINLQKELIKQTIFSRTFLQNERRLKNESDLFKEKNENLTTRQSQNYSQSTILKANYSHEQNDILFNGKTGRLVNFSLYSRLFQKMPSKPEKIKLLKKEMNLYNDKSISIRTEILTIQNEVKFHLFVTSNQTIQNINIKYCQPSLPSITVDLYNSELIQLKEGKQYCIKGSALLLNYEQISFPSFELTYYRMNFDKKIKFQVPLNLHHFITYHPSPFKTLLRSREKVNILRTDRFSLNREIGNIFQLQRVVENLRLTKQKNNIKLLVVGGSIPYSAAKFELYFKLQLNQLQIFGITNCKQTQPIESLLSTFRFSLQENL